MRQIVPRLRDLETAANGVTILGAQPLGRLGTLFGEIADYLTDISGQVDGIATSLVGNRSALERNASSLAAVATEVRTLSATLAGDQLAAAIDSVRWLILALLVIAAIGAAVPAAGALATGWWLRGWLRAPGAPAQPPSGGRGAAPNGPRGSRPSHGRRRRAGSTPNRGRAPARRSSTGRG